MRVKFNTDGSYTLRDEPIKFGPTRDKDAEIARLEARISEYLNTIANLDRLTDSQQVEIDALLAENELLRGLLSAALSVVEIDNAHEDTGQSPLSVTLASGVHFDLVAARKALRGEGSQ